MSGNQGRVVTFYSYKGGTGRTMALANVGCILARGSSAQESRKALMIDWDLDAPGLHRFFMDQLTQAFPDPVNRHDALDQQLGLIDLFCEINRLADGKDDTEEAAQALINQLDVRQYIVATDIPGLDLMKAGQFDDDYSARVNTFAWKELHDRMPSMFRVFAQRMSEEYDFVLIDSRTGITDVSGICTMLMPDTLVVVFTPNSQSLTGVQEIARRAANYRRQADDLRPLTVLPLPSRIETTEPSLQRDWRFGSLDPVIHGYQSTFESLLREIYGLSECRMVGYFNDVQIQHVPYYAYGERIAALHERSDERLSLSRSFEVFTQRLIEAKTPWDSGSVDVVASPDPLELRSSLIDPLASQWDAAWISQHREKAKRGFARLEKPGWMEVMFRVSGIKLNRTQSELLDAATASQILTFGWPIGVILPNVEFRPHPVADGIVAEIPKPPSFFEESYDYWAVRRDGHFYMLKSIFEDQRGKQDELFFDTRIVQLTEVFLYCRRLYANLDVPPGAIAHLTIQHGGLLGRRLGVVNRSRLMMMAPMLPAKVDETEPIEVATPIGDIESDVVELVKRVAAPLFILFDFFKLSHEVYEEIVRNFVAGKVT